MVYLDKYTTYKLSLDTILPMKLQAHSNYGEMHTSAVDGCQYKVIRTEAGEMDQTTKDYFGNFYSDINYITTRVTGPDSKEEYMAKYDVKTSKNNPKTGISQFPSLSKIDLSFHGLSFFDEAISVTIEKNKLTKVESLRSERIREFFKQVFFQEATSSLVRESSEELGRKKIVLDRETSEVMIARIFIAIISLYVLTRFV